MDNSSLSDSSHETALAFFQYSSRDTMKFGQHLMDGMEDQHKRIALEKEVERLQGELYREQELKRVLTSSLQGPVVLPSYSSWLIPPKVQRLLTELGMVEGEVIYLEEKVKELKLLWYEERRKTRKWELQRVPYTNRYNNLQKQIYLPVVDDPQQQPGWLDYEFLRKGKIVESREPYPNSALSFKSLSSTRSYEAKDTYRCSRSQTSGHIGDTSTTDKPNKLSEDLLRCLIGIFLELNQASLNKEARTTPKLTLPCIHPKNFITRNSFNCKAAALFTGSSSDSDPYRILADLDGAVRDIGPYKTFIHITKLSYVDHPSRFLPELEKLRLLMHKLCTVNLTFLNYKQQLAFWINIYNSSMMHAFLQHGLHSSHDKLLELMNKAVINVGGIILNALAIEYFILRHPCETEHGPNPYKVPMSRKEMQVRQAYGLRYPEPNVTFALCRGSWSSPALRVYHPDEIVNDLEKAKHEYLEASVGVTNKRKILLPKLLEWHMQDFAHDIESLVEWIYSQLPRSRSLKKSLMECLNQETKYPLRKTIDIQPYESEFRYLVPH